MLFGRFPSTLLWKYPRMSPEDTQIWVRFLQQNAEDYERFDYDFPVGKGEDPGSHVPENYRKDFIDLTKKRIDAVGYIGKNVTIFEVKPRAGTTALGQLLTYRDLFIKSYPNFNSVSMAVVTNFMNTDEEGIYKQYGIKIFVV